MTSRLFFYSRRCDSLVSFVLKGALVTRGLSVTQGISTGCGCHLHLIALSKRLIGPNKSLANNSVQGRRGAFFKEGGRVGSLLGRRGRARGLLTSLGGRGDVRSSFYTRLSRGMAGRQRSCRSLGVNLTRVSKGGSNLSHVLSARGGTRRGGRTSLQATRRKLTTVARGLTLLTSQLTYFNSVPVVRTSRGDISLGGTITSLSTHLVRVHVSIAGTRRTIGFKGEKGRRERGTTLRRGGSERGLSHSVLRGERRGRELTSRLESVRRGFGLTRGR